MGTKLLIIFSVNVIPPVPACIFVVDVVLVEPIVSVFTPEPVPTLILTADVSFDILIVPVEFMVVPPEPLFIVVFDVAV